MSDRSPCPDRTVLAANGTPVARGAPSTLHTEDCCRDVRQGVPIARRSQHRQADPGGGVALGRNETEENA